MGELWRSEYLKGHFLCCLLIENHLGIDLFHRKFEHSIVHVTVSQQSCTGQRNLQSKFETVSILSSSREFRS